jgi:pSer/pThr/pTyr-binding forkhead associated (FHA) protein
MTMADVLAIPSFLERPQMMGQLIPLGGGDPIPLRKPKLLVGRRPSCDIRLEFPNVSSQHCELEWVNGYWRLRDLRSSNGTKVNGERIDEKFLQPGDTITVAKYQFEIDYAPDPNAAPVEEVDPFSIGLLEKAGIGRGDGDDQPRRPSTRPPTPKSSQPVPPPPKPPRDEMDDDDKALDWMSDE